MALCAGVVCAGAMAATDSVSGGADHPVLRLWEGDAPGALGSKEVDIPTLTVWLADPTSATGAAMLVCPGGGYHTLADHEGSDYARWFNEMGISAFVLKYRLGSAGYHHPVMLQDVTRAMRMVRSRASEWGIDKDRVGVIGSSAGGHLASTLLTHYDAGDKKSTDTVERESSRPSLGILCYPVITMGEQTHKGSRKNLLGDSPAPELIELLSNEKQVTKHTPPTFIFYTADDAVVPVQNGLLFATALADQDVPFELHVYPHGSHGLGLGTREWNPAGRHDWTHACEKWLDAQGFRDRKSGKE